MRPARETIRRSGQTYFVTSQTVERQPFFRHERWAVLMQEVFQHYRGVSYLLHAYVLMPDHFHLIISPQGSLERAMQNIKGGFSFRAKRAFDWKHDIWQPGFSDHGIRDAKDWDRHIAYIHYNPVKAKLCLISEDYQYLAVNLDPIPQRLKPLTLARSHGGAEAPPLQKPGTGKFKAEAPPLQKAGTGKFGAEAPTFQKPGTAKFKTESPTFQKAGTGKFEAEARPLQKPGTGKFKAGGPAQEAEAVFTQSLTRTEE